MDPYLGEIRQVSFNWAPKGWALCDGAVLQVSQYQALSALLGTLYGGDGKTTFGLPDLRGRVVVHPTTGYPQGTTGKGGAEGVSVTDAQMPGHTHLVAASTTAPTRPTPVGNMMATPTSGANLFAPLGAATPVPLSPSSVTTSGAGATHNNMQPFLVLNYIIATQGIWPPRP